MRQHLLVSDALRLCVFCITKHGKYIKLHHLASICAIGNHVPSLLYVLLCARAGFEESIALLYTTFVGLSNWQFGTTATVLTS